MWREHPFHALLLLTEKPARWPAAIVWLPPLALAAAVGVAWRDWLMGLCSLLFALSDWTLLDSLPHRGFSFGPWQPPFLALSVVRGLAFFAAAPWAGSWPAGIGLILFQTVVFAGTWWGMRIEPFRVEVTHVEVPNPYQGGAGRVRVVQLSDLHVERLTARERALPAMVRALEPDVLVLTGDFLNTSYNRDPQAVADLAAMLGALDARLGIYAVWGTEHVDYPDILRPVLEGAGIEVLEDRAVEVPLDGKAPGEADGRLWLMGVTPTWEMDADARTVRSLRETAPPGAFSLLLHHLPDLMPDVAGLGVDLYLAGHTHGGQWRVPGFGALVTSSRYGKRYEAGLYVGGQTTLYVSRGLGLEGFGTPRARLFCRPEIVVFDIGGSAGG